MGLSLAVYLRAAANVECFLLFTAMLTMPLSGARVADIKQTDSTRHWGREPQAVVSIRHAAGIMCAERGACSQSEEREGAS